MHNMEDSDKTELTNEYIKNCKVFLIILKLGAFNRFDIKNGQFVSISRFSIIYSFIAMGYVCGAVYAIHIETSNFLILPEYITVLELAILNNVVLLNIHIFNRHSGAKLLDHCIEIDLFLGVKQTKFMREIVIKDIIIWSCSVASFELLLAAILITAFSGKIPLYLYFVGIMYFQFLFTLCYDHAINVSLYLFSTSPHYHHILFSNGKDMIAIGLLNILYTS